MSCFVFKVAHFRMSADERGFRVGNKKNMSEKVMKNVETCLYFFHFNVTMSSVSKICS